MELRYLIPEVQIKKAEITDDYRYLVMSYTNKNIKIEFDLVDVDMLWYTELINKVHNILTIITQLYLPFRIKITRQNPQSLVEIRYYDPYNDYSFDFLNNLNKHTQQKILSNICTIDMTFYYFKPHNKKRKICKFDYRKVKSYSTSKYKYKYIVENNIVIICRYKHNQYTKPVIIQIETKSANINDEKIKQYISYIEQDLPEKLQDIVIDVPNEDNIDSLPMLLIEQKL